MKEVLEDITKLYDDLVKENKSVAKTVQENADKTEKLNERDKDLSEKDKDLNSREANVKVIENVKELADATELGIKQLKADNAQLKIEKDAFETYQADTKKENLALKKSLESSIEAANAKEKKYEEEIEKLKVKEKELREKIAKELLK